MRPLLIVIGLLSSGALLGGQQHGPLPLPSAVVPPPTSSAADSGVRLALIQPLDAPVVLEAVGHTDDRLGGTVGVHNLTNRAVSAVALAFTIGNAPDATASAFRHVETLALTLQAGETASIDVPGIPLRLLRSLSSAEAPVVEIAIVGVRFTSGPAWRAAGRGSWLGRPDLVTPLACVDDLGQTQPVDPLTAAGGVCQGGGL